MFLSYIGEITVDKCLFILIFTKILDVSSTALWALKSSNQTMLKKRSKNQEIILKL